MSEVKVIGIGNDHAAVDLKNEIKAYLEEKGYKVVNYGTDSSESCDYPIYGAKVGHAFYEKSDSVINDFDSDKHASDLFQIYKPVLY